MSDTWDLGVLYRDFDDSFSADVTALDGAIEALNDLAHEASALPHRIFLRRLTEEYGRYLLLAEKLGSFAELRRAADAADTVAAGWSDRLQEQCSAMAGADTVLQRMVAAMDDLEEVLANEEALAPYAYLFRRMKADSRYLLSEREEELLARMDISGAGAWENLRNAMTGSVKVRYRDRELTLSDVRNLAHDSDPVVRKEAYEAELACYESIRTPVAYALNSIKMQVISECKLRGYESPLAQALHLSHMKRETLDALMGAVEEYLPVFRRYLRVKGRIIGHPDGIAWYDMMAPMGTAGRTFTVEEAKTYLLRVFGSFDPAMREMGQQAFAENWVDFFPRPGKMEGAFDYGLPNVNESRVLTNFGGSFRDVTTLAHELGHAYHDRQVFSHPLWCRSYTMPVAETASTFNELLVTDAALSECGDDAQRLNLLDNRLADDCGCVCDIYSRYRFESAVFAARSTEFMDAGRLCDMMREAQQAAYGDGLAQEVRHPYMWLCKSHYYSGALSFYNFPYAFGCLLSRGLFTRYSREGAAFVPGYRQFLQTTPMGDVEDSAALLGIDLTDRAFWRSGLDAIARDVEAFCHLLEK